LEEFNVGSAEEDQLRLRAKFGQITYEALLIGTFVDTIQYDVMRVNDICTQLDELKKLGSSSSGLSCRGVLHGKCELVEELVMMTLVQNLSQQRTICSSAVVECRLLPEEEIEYERSCGRSRFELVYHCASDDCLPETGITFEWIS
jgi:hypothetical protein